MKSRGMLGRDHHSSRRLLSQTAGAGRPMPPRPALPSSTTAFVFQGGGSLAAGQVGMVRALVDAGIVADLVVGSSAGALNAVAFATRPHADLEALQALWTSIPAHVVATDFLSGEPFTISDGATVPALLASSAFPGLYPPVTISGRRFVDGGVAADLPILQAEQLGATVTYVLPAALIDDLDAPVHGPMAMAYRALGQLLDAAVRRDIAAATGQVHVLPAPTSTASNPVDFRDTARLIEDGYRLTTAWLAAARAIPAHAVPTTPALALVSSTN